jgi:hypothetical protein
MYMKAGSGGTGVRRPSPKGDLMLAVLIEIAVAGCVGAGLLTICACIVSARSACRAEMAESEVPDRPAESVPTLAAEPMAVSSVAVQRG